MGFACEGSYPEGDHGGEVEGGDSGADTQWDAVGEGVHVSCDAVHGLSQLEVGDSAAVLDNLCGEDAIKKNSHVWCGPMVGGRSYGVL